MKKKIIGILLFFLGFILVLFVLNATARPTYTGSHDSCHNSPGGYTITINRTGTITADNSSVIFIEISATGSNLFMQGIPDAKDNNEFIIFPTTDRIVDNSGNDTDSNANAITVIFNITTPATDGFYVLFIIAGENLAAGQQPDFAYANIEFSIGGVEKTIDYIGRFFSHTGFYIIGGIAIISLATGTILYIINQEKFTKAHGLLAGTSLILTTINIIAVLPITASRLPIVAAEVFNLTFLHIILGIIGYIAGIIAFLAGLSGHRSRLPGFIALGCWGFNYIQGLFSIFVGGGFLL